MFAGLFTGLDPTLLDRVRNFFRISRGRVGSVSEVFGIARAGPGRPDPAPDPRGLTPWTDLTRENRPDP